jgi:hypothetical protein
MIKYIEMNLLGGWRVSVQSSGRTIGHIRRHGDGISFLYFKGPNNQLNWSIQCASLADIKQEIERHHGRSLGSNDLT